MFEQLNVDARAIRSKMDENCVEYQSQKVPAAAAADSRLSIMDQSS
jgi:hypothetical protein